jgi:hypothetical protein
MKLSGAVLISAAAAAVGPAIFEATMATDSKEMIINNREIYGWDIKFSKKIFECYRSDLQLKYRNPFIIHLLISRILSANLVCF